MSYYPLLLLFLVGCFCGGHSAEQPNILFILAGTSGWSHQSSYIPRKERAVVSSCRRDPNDVMITYTIIILLYLYIMHYNFIMGMYS